MSNMNKFGLPSGLGGIPAAPPQRVGVYEAPTDFVELPSQGKFYPRESPLFGVEKLEIKFMTAKEEDLLVSPALVKAGISFDRVIESLLVDKRIKAKELLVGDKNAILLNIRKNAFGENYEFYYLCKNCGVKNETTKNLNEVEIKIPESDENCSISENGTILINLPKSKVLLELKMLTGEDETYIQQVVDKRIKNNLPAEAMLTRYRNMIVSVNNNTSMEGIVSFINSMPVMDSAYLRKKYNEISPDIILNYSHNCQSCSNLNEGGVPIMADFFPF